MVLHLKEDALEYVAAICKHHGLTEIGQTNTRKDLKDRPRVAVWVQQRKGFLLRSGGKSSFFPARSKHLPKGSGKGRSGGRKVTNPSDVDIMGEVMAFEKLKNHVDALEG